MAEQLAAGKLLLDEPAEAVARLRINNPAKRNALDHDILDALAEVLPRLDHEIDLRCVLITGAEGHFSAGYDIGSISEQSFESEAEALVAHPFHAAIEALLAHPWPTIAAIEGDCLGGGLELAVSCDLRICAGGARLGMPPVKLGLIYGHTGLRRFLDTIGLAHVNELFLTGANVTSDRALQIGLVNFQVGEADLEPAAVKLAERVAANAPLSLRGNKQAIRTLADNPVLSAEQERELVELRESCFASEDFREGITAFREKRRPQWRGR
jgi:enoyl-CoA hydratase/carnithine racemase